MTEITVSSSVNSSTDAPNHVHQDGSISNAFVENILKKLPQTTCEKAKEITAITMETARDSILESLEERTIQNVSYVREAFLRSNVPIISWSTYCRSFAIFLICAETGRDLLERIANNAKNIAEWNLNREGHILSVPITQTNPSLWILEIGMNGNLYIYQAKEVRFCISDRKAQLIISTWDPDNATWLQPLYTAYEFIKSKIVKGSVYKYVQRKK
ncbi:MAG: hypothetical protein LBB63_01585 [Holosporaceae bacterium]|jgi:hypothetical protein|nr:hypothetical protein [Holosporaceae bacterium]